MEWQQIIGFYRVARLGSFTRAAEATFRSQSALSQQVKALEEEFDCQLFERIGKRKLKLTAAGEEFLRFSEEVLNRRECLKESLNELKGSHTGPLRIAGPFTSLYHLVRPVLKDYMARFPQVRLTILDRPQKEVIELVRNGDVDFGFAMGSSVPRDLVGLRWKKLETVLMVHAEHPLTGEKHVAWTDIARYPLILPPKSSRHRMAVEEELRKLGIAYTVVMESSNVELSSVYVEMGLGVSFATVVPDLQLLKHRKLQFIPLTEYFEPDYVALVSRIRTSLPSYKSAFAEQVLERPTDAPI
jgi:DNA-binding transcriptional LysR family regulator